MYRSSNPAVKLTLDNTSFDVNFGQLFEISDSGIEVYRGDYLKELKMNDDDKTYSGLLEEE